jgi:hypothetical protein
VKHGPQIVLFCGGRDCTFHTHGDRIKADVFGLTRGSIVLHGGADGVDKIAGWAARFHARERELHEVIVPALWSPYGKSAGPRRNAAMLMLRPDFAFAYPTGGPGTADMLKRLAAANIPHVIHG